VFLAEVKTTVMMTGCCIETKNYIHHLSFAVADVMKQSLLSRQTPATC